jgi:hypothetical protein
MDRPAIPQQVDRPAEVTREVTQEGLDIEACEIVSPTPDVERMSEPFSAAIPASRRTAFRVTPRSSTSNEFIWTQVASLASLVSSRL